MIPHSAAAAVVSASMDFSCDNTMRANIWQLVTDL